jgi:hypothetical protein
MNDVHNSFFGTGYKKKEEKPLNQTQGYMKVIKGTYVDLDETKPLPETVWPEINISEDCQVAINVMGKIYSGQNKIEIFGGDIIIDDIKTGKMPNTSGTWMKVLKGKKIKNKILTIVS